MEGGEWRVEGGGWGMKDGGWKKGVCQILCCSKIVDVGS